MADNMSELSHSVIREIFTSSSNANYTIVGLYIPVFLMALFANTLVIIVVVKYHYMRSVTNYFLVNLSVADLLVTLVCMPGAIWDAVTNLWYFGEMGCMLIGYLQSVAVGASVFTITTMAIDRYLAITQPIGFPRWFNKTSTLVVILALWLVSLAIFSPMLMVMKTTRELFNFTKPEIEFMFCNEDWSDFPEHYSFYIGIFWFIMIYAVPGVLMMVAYALMGRRLCSVRPPFDTHEGSASTQQGFRLVRERRRVAWILLLLAFLFAACWLPHSILNLALDTATDDGASTTRRHVRALLPYGRLLGHANSALNPIIYCFMTRNFRRSVRELVTHMRAGCTVRRRGGATRRCQYAESGSATSQRWPQKFQLEPVLKMRSIRNQSSTRTTKTCAV